MPGLAIKHYNGQGTYNYIPTLLATMIVNGEDVSYGTSGGNSGKIVAYKMNNKIYEIKSNTTPESLVKNWKKLSSTTGFGFYFQGNQDMVLATNIFKTAEFGGGGGGTKGFNMGNVSEGIFAAAVFAKFTVGRSKNISQQDVVGVLTDLQDVKVTSPAGKKSVSGKFSRTAPNKVIKEDDNIEYKFGLSANNHKALITKANWQGESFQGLIRGACTYANSVQVAQWVDLIYTNGRVDNICVFADGEANQSGTKVDVKVYCSDNDPDDDRLKELNINVSLKVNGIRQFGQVGGTVYDNQLNFWTQLFPGINITNPITSVQYNNKANPIGKGATDYAPAISYYYEEMHKKLKNLERTHNEELAEAFANGVTYYGSLNETGVELLDIHEIKGATSVDIDKIRYLLEGRGIRVGNIVMSNPVKGNSPLPTIKYEVMIDNKWVDFLQTRVKKSGSNKKGPYYRNIIEKLDGFSKLLGVKVPDNHKFEFGKTTNRYY